MAKKNGKSIKDAGKDKSKKKPVKKAAPKKAAKPAKPVKKAPAKKALKSPAKKVAALAKKVLAKVLKPQAPAKAAVVLKKVGAPPKVGGIPKVAPTPKVAAVPKVAAPEKAEKPAKSKSASAVPKSEKAEVKAKSKSVPSAPAEPVAPELDAEVEEEELVDEEVVLTDAEGRRYCRVKDCDQLSAVDGYCRYHYLAFWKKIQVRKKILSEGKLERYIEELTLRYPDKFLDMLRKDLRSEKEFLAAIQELEIDESAVDNEFEDEAQTYIDEVRGIEPVARDDEDF